MESEFSTIDFLLVTIGWVTFLIVALFNENRTKDLVPVFSFKLEYNVPPRSCRWLSIVFRTMKVGQTIRKRVRKVVAPTTFVLLPFLFSMIDAFNFIIIFQVKRSYTLILQEQKNYPLSSDFFVGLSPTFYGFTLRVCVGWRSG